MRPHVFPARARPRWWLSLARLLLLLDALALAVVVFDAPYFKVARVTLSGLDRTTASEVMRAARLDGQNVLLLDCRRIEQSVERLPTVKRAIASRQLPDRVSIAVQERQPRAIWESKATRFLVDDEGVVIGPATGNEGLLVVADGGDKVPSLGTRVDAQAIDLAEKLSSTLVEEFGLQAQSYQYSWPSGLSLLTNQGWRLSFGGADEFDYKISVLRAILETVRQRDARIEVVDLQSRDRPYYR